MGKTLKSFGCIFSYVTAKAKVWAFDVHMMYIAPKMMPLNCENSFWFKSCRGI